jgi:hypothetical protein
MVLPIAGIVAAARLARAAQVATRTASGIKTAKTVEKIYREGSAAPIVSAPTKSQSQINAEGIAKARAALNMPAKGTTAAKNADEARKRAAEAQLYKSRIKGK